jgi:hypothetical protein
VLPKQDQQVHPLPESTGANFEITSNQNTETAMPTRVVSKFGPSIIASEILRQILTQVI